MDGQLVYVWEFSQANICRCGSYVSPLENFARTQITGEGREVAQHVRIGLIGIPKL